MCNGTYFLVLYWIKQTLWFSLLSVIVLLSNLFDVEKKLQGRNISWWIFSCGQPAINGRPLDCTKEVCARPRVNERAHPRTDHPLCMVIDNHPGLTQRCSTSNPTHDCTSQSNHISVPAFCSNEVSFELQFLGKHLGVFPVCFPLSISWLTLGKVQPDERMFHSPRQGNRAYLKFGVSHPGNPLAGRAWMWGHEIWPVQALL